MNFWFFMKKPPSIRRLFIFLYSYFLKTKNCRSNIVENITPIKSGIRIYQDLIIMAYPVLDRYTLSGNKTIKKLRPHFFSFMFFLIWLGRAITTMVIAKIMVVEPKNCSIIYSSKKFFQPSYFGLVYINIKE